MPQRAATGIAVQVGSVEAAYPQCGSQFASQEVSTTLPIPEDIQQREPDDDSMIANLREAFGLPPNERSAIVPRIEPLSEAAGKTEMLAPFAPPLVAGSRLGDFEVLGELGRGGMGIVYRARQVSLGRTVALKVLPSHARRNTVAVQRFHTETLAASRLHHTNIVSIYAQGEDAEHLYYAMALVDGVSLDRALHDQPELLSSAGGGSSSSARRLGPGAPSAPSTPRVSNDDDSAAVSWSAADFRHLARRIAEVADALAYAHTQGVLHRDIKPHNLLVDSSGRMHVTDFGLARLTDAPHLTVTGEIMGTPAYLAPEQVRGDVHDIDHRTDIYALGVTLYELITGRKPFAGSIRAQIMHNILSLEPAGPRKRNANVPRDLETICLRAMDKERDRRHRSAAELADDLRRFADGRPILSRRVSAAERAAKWVRRHKAIALAGVATAAAIAVTVGLIAVGAASRAREARSLARSAYEQLAYFDYREPELVADSLIRAKSLGADTIECSLAEALAAMGRNRPAEAINALGERLRIDSAAAGDPRVYYLLAWAQRRNNAAQDAAASLAHAEALREALTNSGAPEDALAADAWFYRGLVRHFDDPTDALQSYRYANARRARGGGFYPQALLHLARARNQQLYALRTLDGREEAEASLKQLVDAGYYKAYPYYLLSISNRLAAEIYEGSRGARDDTARRHFAAALDWARAGQALDPNDDRPVAAEAECLERLGDYAAAIEARTRQLALADADAKRCEARHYRWRLHYWLGNYSDALTDLQAGHRCDPGYPYYQYLYPALIRAEQGDTNGALGVAREWLASAPRSAEALLWTATTLRLLGAGREADEVLARGSADVDHSLDPAPAAPPGWNVAMLRFAASGDRTELEKLIAENPQPWRLEAEIDFHDAIRSLASGNLQAARELLSDAYRSFDGERRYTYHARVLIERLHENHQWPAWLAVSSQEPNASADERTPQSRGEGVP